MKTPSPSTNLRPYNQKIHWGWFDPVEKNYLISNQRNLWTVSPTTGKTEVVHARNEDESLTPEGIGAFELSSISTETVQTFMAEGLRGFEYLHLKDYSLEKESNGNVLLFLSHAQTWGLSGRVRVKHKLATDLTLFFKDRLVEVGAQKKRFSSHTQTHCAHPTDLSFFTGNNKGEVHWHKLDLSGHLRSVKIHDFTQTIRDIAISESGEHLFVGALGSLAHFQLENRNYRLISEISCSPRQIIVKPNDSLIVNLGRNGISSFEYSDSLKLLRSESIGTSVDLIIADLKMEQLLCIPQNPQDSLTILEFGAEPVGI